MDSFKWIWEQIKGYKIRIIFAFVLVFFCSMLNMVVPYISGKIVDDVIIGKQKNLLMPIIGIMIGVTVVKAIARYTYQMTFEKISQDTVFNIREMLYSKLQSLDFEFFDKTRTGDIMTRVTGDVDMVRYFVAWIIFTVFENAAVFVFAIIVMFSISFKFTFVLLCLTPVTGYFGYKLANTVKPAFMNIREQFGKLNSVVQENISGNRVVKAFAKEDYEIEKFSKQNKEFMDSNIRAAGVWEKYLPILDSLGGLLGVVMVMVGGIMVINKSITMGELVMFNSLIFAINNPMRMVGWLINDIQRFTTSVEKITEILNTEPNINSSPYSIKSDKIKGMVEFKNVSFSYGDENVLKKINFRVKPGQTVAIIGPTGSGKSTLMNLLSRFYDCTEGEILIDGINVKKMDVKNLRENIGVAMQDIFLFSDTIEGNIAYGVPDASLEDVKKVAKIADAHSFIEEMPEGYDTIIGERGVGLSGGQRQRIALARALLKNPSILILDDTTSSVDMETEQQIHKALKSYFNSRTTFIIAHRISTVKNADMILVLDNGKIVEQGKHDELIAKKGYYYSVYTVQSGDFDDNSQKEVG